MIKDNHKQNPLLSKYKNTPTLQTVLPISKKTASYRPHSYGEYFMLNSAWELKDSKNSMLTLIKFVVACTGGNEEFIKSLPLQDLDWLFLQIIIATSGYTSNVKVTCGYPVAKTDVDTGVEHTDSCGTEMIGEIDLDQIEMVNANDDWKQFSVIDLTNDSCIQLKYPTVGEFLDIIQNFIYDPDKDLKLVKKAPSVDDMITYACIDSIWLNKETNCKLGYDGSDEQFTIEEFEEFIECLPMNIDLEGKFSKFKDSLPHLYYTKSNIHCPKCNNKSRIELTSITDFF